MRGKDIGDDFISNPARITPAYAGKSFPVVFIISNSRDHPRLCGEKFESATYKKADEGSPPPMRGKVTSFTT